MRCLSLSKLDRVGTSLNECGNDQAVRRYMEAFNKMVFWPKHEV
jgi:hypothetical protein